MLETEIRTALALAREASRAVLEEYALEIVAEQKIGSDNYSEPVTEADRRASRILTSGLRAAFPSDAILSEEEPDDAAARTSRDRVWIIDPIDGTAGFIKKDGDFAVQFGLAERGRPVLGIVVLPAYDIAYYGGVGLGAFRQTGSAAPVEIHTSAVREFGRMAIAVSRHHRNPRIARIDSHFGFAREVRRGSVGLKVGLIAEQSCDLYVTLSSRTKFWDTCGPQAILEAAGGRLTNLFGRPIDYTSRDVRNYNGVLATNGAAHRGIVEHLAPLLSEFGRLEMKPKKFRGA